MDKENEAYLHNGILTQQLKEYDIIKFAGQWMEHEYNHFKGGNPDLETQIWHVFIIQWLLTDK